MKKRFLALVLAICFLIPGGTSFASEKKDIRVERIFGSNRYETSVNISKNIFDCDDDTVDAAVVASGQDYPDALVASALVNQEKIPLYLTKTDSISNETISEIARLKPKKVYIVGGDSSVSVAVEKELTKLFTVQRVKGSNRYETSKKVNELRYELLSEELDEDKIVNYVTSGQNFPDALSAGPLAGMLDMDGNGFANLVLAESNKGIKNPVMIGGDGSVKGSGKRISGPSRYLTSLEVAKAYKEKFGELYTVVVASGEDFPDALSASTVAAYHSSPILLVPKDKDIDPALISFIRENANNIIVVGGNGSVSEENLHSLIYDKDSAFAYAKSKVPKEFSSTISKKRYLTGYEKIDIIELFLDANNAIEAVSSIWKETALNILGLKDDTYDIDLLVRVATYKLFSNIDTKDIVGFLDVNGSKIRSLNKEDLKPYIDVLAKGLISNNKTDASIIGDLSDPYVALKLGKEYEKAKVLTGHNLLKAGVDLITNDKATGFNIVKSNKVFDFDKDRTVVYRHDSIDHIHQLLGLLRSDGLTGRVAIEPKTSSYEYSLDWGPIPKPTEKYEVVKAPNDKYIANALEFNLYIEFQNPYHMYKFNSLVYYDATRFENRLYDKKIKDSWFVPLYSVDSDEMYDPYYKIIDNTLVDGDYTLHSFSKEEDSPEIIKSLNSSLKTDKAKALDIYVNRIFYKFLHGEKEEFS
ncbi:MAG: cell wall-binding repeat-containing protein [Lagierella massiliensis]|nr:cell wall-binding repeat-containing protein [Lagierella massiliensis]